MAENENIATVQKMYADFGRGDIASILSSVTEDVDWGTETAATEIPWYRIRKGPEGVADFFATLATEVDFKKFEPSLFAAAGDQVLVRVDYEYHFKRNGRGAPGEGGHQFTPGGRKGGPVRPLRGTATVRDAWNG